MTFVVPKLRPWILSRGVSVFILNSGMELHKCSNTYVHLNYFEVLNCIQKLTRRTLKTVSQDKALKEELYYEYENATEKSLRKKAMTNMQKIFGLKPKSAQDLVSNCPNLEHVSLKNAQCNVNYLTEKGLSMETLEKNPWLLTHKIETIMSKLDILSKLNIKDLNVMLPLLQLTLNQLREYSKMEEKEHDMIPQGNRLKYTSDKLQCDLAEVCKVFGQHEFLYSIPFVKYSSIMEKLLDAEISPSHILRDVWVFQYGITKIETRLAILKEVGVKPVKPWMLRSSPKIFEITVQRVLSRKEVLGENSVVDFLTQQLECDEDTVQYLASKYPILLRKHVPKLKELFDFLYEEGFTPQQVIQVPRILFHSVETIRCRLAELRDAGSNPTSLMTLCKSRREFARIVEVALKRKLRTLSDT